MGLLDEAAALAPRIGGRCSVGALLDSLPELERAQVVELLGSTFSNRTVANVFDAHGWDVERQTVGRHRSGECKCPRR